MICVALKRLVVGLAATALTAGTAAAQTYTFKTYKAPMMGSTIFEAVNNRGAKLSEVSRSGSTACSLLSGGATTVISDPSASSTSTTCLGVSNTGTVVGYYQVPGQAAGVSAGFSVSNGTYTDFIVPAASPQMGGTQLNAVSVNGLLAGTYSDAQGFQHVFTSHGSPSKLGLLNIPGRKYLIAVGVNNAGDLVVQDFGSDGATYSGSFYHAAGSGTALIEISYPGSTQDVCHAINTSGEVACHYADSQGLQHGFIYYSAGNTYSDDLDAPASTGGTLLFGINDAGLVVGATTPNPKTSIRLGLTGTPPAN